MNASGPRISTKSSLRSTLRERRVPPRGRRVGARARRSTPRVPPRRRRRRRPCRRNNQTTGPPPTDLPPPGRGTPSSSAASRARASRARRRRRGARPPRSSTRVREEARPGDRRRVYGVGVRRAPHLGPRLRVVAVRARPPPRARAGVARRGCRATPRRLGAPLRLSWFRGFVGGWRGRRRQTARRDGTRARPTAQGSTGPRRRHRRAGAGGAARRRGARAREARFPPR